MHTYSTLPSPMGIKATPEAVAAPTPERKHRKEREKKHRKDKKERKVGEGKWARAVQYFLGFFGGKKNLF